MGIERRDISQRTQKRNMRHIASDDDATMSAGAASAGTEARDAAQNCCILLATALNSARQCFDSDILGRVVHWPSHAEERRPCLYMKEHEWFAGPRYEQGQHCLFSAYM